MRFTQKVAAVALVAGLSGTIYSIVRANESASAATTKAKKAAAAQIVDQSALATARQLAQLADTPEEQKLAKEALRLGEEVFLASAPTGSLYPVTYREKASRKLAIVFDANLLLFSRVTGRLVVDQMGPELHDEADFVPHYRCGRRDKEHCDLAAQYCPSVPAVLRQFRPA